MTEGNDNEEWRRREKLLPRTGSSRRTITTGFVVVIATAPPERAPGVDFIALKIELCDGIRPPHRKTLPLIILLRFFFNVL